MHDEIVAQATISGKTSTKQLYFAGTRSSAKAASEIAAAIT
jgi:hypothetical protein